LSARGQSAQDREVEGAFPSGIEENIMATAKPEEAGDELKREMKALRDDLAALVGTVKEMAAQRAEAVADSARETVENIGESMKMTAAEAQRRGEEMAGEVEEMIRNRPLTAVLVAAAVGYLVGKISR
jgi:ElaB/YqjD/DUF883 family membrane-anchored ribosome-binding protein